MVEAKSHSCIAAFTSNHKIKVLSFKTFLLMPLSWYDYMMILCEGSGGSVAMQNIFVDANIMVNDENVPQKKDDKC